MYQKYSYTSVATILNTVKKLNKKYLFLVGLISCFILYWVWTWNWHDDRERLGIKCYTRTCEGGDCPLSLGDIVGGDGRKPALGKSVFFHETSCSKTGIVKLKPR